jgi:hypothetical protein
MADANALGRSNPGRGRSPLRQARRPCPRRALADGHERSPAVNHGSTVSVTEERRLDRPLLRVGARLGTPGAWSTGQSRARAVCPGHPGPAIYLGKCSVPAGSCGLVFPDTEVVPVRRSVAERLVGKLLAARSGSMRGSQVAAGSGDWPGSPVAWLSRGCGSGRTAASSPSPTARASMVPTPHGQ